MYKSIEDPKWEILFPKTQAKLININDIEFFLIKRPIPKSDSPKYKEFTKKIWSKALEIAEKEGKNISNGPLTGMKELELTPNNKLKIPIWEEKYEDWAATSYAPAHPEKFKDIFAQLKIDSKKIPQNWKSRPLAIGILTIIKDDQGKQNIIILKRASNPPNIPFSWNGALSFPGITLGNTQALLKGQGEYLKQEIKQRVAQTLSSASYKINPDSINISGILCIEFSNLYEELYIIALAETIADIKRILNENKEHITSPQPPSNTKKYSDIISLSLENKGKEVIDFLIKNHKQIHAGFDAGLIMLLANLHLKEFENIIKNLNYVKRMG